ncbi:MAG: stage II sporulation protein E [Ruminococcaceae bacterium]|nr:stage II sporulation protein E [Oscillospiraceae bacterium]
MEEKRFQNVLMRVYDMAMSPQGTKVVSLIATFLSGFMFSRGLVFGRFTPFGIAAVAAVPKNSMWAAFIGVFLGHIIPSAALVPARYIASAAAVIAIRWSLSEIKKISDHSFFVSAVAFLPLMATGLTMSVINASSPDTVALYVAESFLSGGCAYFFRRSVLILTAEKRKLNFDSADIASLSITLGVFISALSNISVAGISIGRIITVIMILYCAGSGGISGGAVAGVTAGAIQGLSVAGLSYLSGAYGLGGLVSGVFSSLGKLPSVVAFIIANGIASLQIGENSSILLGLLEVMVASVVYMILPKSQKLSSVFTDRREKLTGDTLRNSIISRLSFTADALSHVSDSIEEIAKRLTFNKGLNNVMNASVSEICPSCSRCSVCWKKDKGKTVKHLSVSIPVLKKENRINEWDFHEEMKEYCHRQDKLAESINKHYRDYIAAQALEIKSAQIRKMTGEQFEATSGLLKDIAEDFSSFKSFDREAGERVEEVLLHNDLEPLDVCCRVDKYGRLTVNAEIMRNRDKKLNKALITREISTACGRSFSPPSVCVSEGLMRLTMIEKPELDVSFGSFQHSADNSTFCGDSFRGFYDGQGHYITVLCDGMGTGGRAAVDGVMASTMAETLIKAGVGFDTALRLINTALMAKSSDESLSTLDIVCVDLFTGKTEFRKAGAAGSFIRRGRRVDYYEEISLPVGIMNGSSFAYFDHNLKENDIIVMVSDGATVCGTDFIKEIIENFEDDDPAYLAKQIVSEARKQRSDGHEDDVTAVVLKIK